MTRSGTTYIYAGILVPQPKKSKRKKSLRKLFENHSSKAEHVDLVVARSYDDPYKIFESDVVSVKPFSGFKIVAGES